MNRLSEVKDLILFIKREKAYLLPFVLLLVIIALFIVFLNSTPAAVFIYPLI